MKNFKPLIFTILGTLILTTGVVYAAAGGLTVPQGGTGNTSFTSSRVLYGAGTSRLQEVATGTVTCTGSATCGAGSYVLGSNLTIDVTGSGGSGLSTTSPWTVGQVAYVTSNAAVTSVATGTVSGAGIVTVTGNRYVLGGGLVITANYNPFTNPTATSFATTSGMVISNASSTFAGNLLITGNSTTTNATTTAFFSGTASSTNLFSTTGRFSSLQIDGVGAALVLSNSGSAVSAYGGVTCTNQFLRALSAAGASTCAQVGAADVSLANLTATDSTLTFSGTYNGSTARTIGLNLGNSNTWLAQQLHNTPNGFGTSTPWGMVSIATTTSQNTVPLFVVGSSTVSDIPLQVSGFGKTIGRDQVNSWTGVLSPTHGLVLSSGTTTTWTASTTATAYSPFVVTPFAGTVQQIRCLTDASFLGVNIQVNGSNITPSYFVASTTVGKIIPSAGNTFTAGQKILANFGTTTTASALEISCTLDITETP